MKSYYFQYSFLGSGVIEIKATSLSYAELLFSNVSNQLLILNTDFDGGLAIDCIEDDEGNSYEEGESDNEETCVEDDGYVVND